MSNPISTASNPRVGPLERVRHLKRGTEYEVLGDAELQVSVARGEPVELLETTLDPEFVCCEGDRLVIYKGSDGKLWAREVSEFRDGRFETIASAPSPEAGGDLPADLQAAYDAGFKASGEGWNGEYPEDVMREGGYKDGRSDWINGYIFDVVAARSVIRSGKLVASTQHPLARKGSLSPLRDDEPEATPKSLPSQTPVDPQMTVEEAREAFARQRAEADRDFDEDLMPGGFN